MSQESHDHHTNFTQASEGNERNHVMLNDENEASFGLVKREGSAVEIAANFGDGQSDEEQWMKGGLETYSMFLQSYD